MNQSNDSSASDNSPGLGHQKHGKLDKHRKLFKRLLIIAAIHVVVLILIPAANYINCRLQLPDEFKNSLQGKFSSDDTAFVSGRVFVNKDFSDMNPGESQEVDIAIYYNFWSFHKPAQIVQTRLTCTKYEGLVTASTPANSALQLKILALPGKPLIGVYRTTGPDDYGHFTILHPAR